MPARYVPPSGFGYPLDGFLPAIPCRLYFTPAALMGFTLRSFPLSKGIRRVTTRKPPHTVSPAVVPAAEAANRPDKLRFLGFDPPESPWRTNTVLVRSALAAPLGFSLLGLSHEDLARAFTQVPLTCFADPTARPPTPPTPQSINQPSLRPATATENYSRKAGQPF